MSGSWYLPFFPSSPKVEIPQSVNWTWNFFNSLSLLNSNYTKEVTQCTGTIEKSRQCANLFYFWNQYIDGGVGCQILPWLLLRAVLLESLELVRADMIQIINLLWYCSELHRFWFCGHCCCSKFSLYFSAKKKHLCRCGQKQWKLWNLAQQWMWVCLENIIASSINC